MTPEQGDLILEIVKQLQSDVAEIKRDMIALGGRLMSLDDDMRSLVTAQVRLTSTEA